MAYVNNSTYNNNSNAYGVQDAVHAFEEILPSSPVKEGVVRQQSFRQSVSSFPNPPTSVG